jgi:hypothetical protein
LTALSDRLRRIIGQPQPQPQPQPEAAAPRESRIPNPESRLPVACLGGRWDDGSFLVERRFERDAVYGRETVGALWTRLAAAEDEAPLLAGG